MSSHAKLSPSSSSRWIACPGSVRLSEDVPDPAGEAAREGTFAHAIAEQCLKEDKSPFEFVGHSDGEFTCDNEMATHISVYVDAVNALADGADSTVIEAKVRWTPQVWGTADAIVWVDDVMHIFDFKYGRNEVLAEENTQLKVYAIAAMNTFKPACRAAKFVHLHIVQPRLFGGAETHKVAEYSTLRIKRWSEGKLKPAAKAALAEDAACNPGDHCLYCPGKINCHAYRTLAMAAATDVFPDGEITEAFEPPKPDELSPNRLAVVLKAAPLMIKWFEAVEKYAAMKAREGAPPTGFKLVETYGNRRWKDEDEAVRMFREAGIDPMVSKMASPNQIQQRLGGPRKDAKAFVDGLCERKVTGDKLVPMSDSRPAINHNKADVFE